MQLSIDVRGIPLTVDDTIFDDFRVLRLFDAMTRKGDVSACVEFGERVLGDEQMDNAMEQLETDGVCRVSEIAPFFLEVVDAAASAKDACDPKN